MRRRVSCSFRKTGPCGWHKSEVKCVFVDTGKKERVISCREKVWFSAHKGIFLVDSQLEGVHISFFNKGEQKGCISICHNKEARVKPIMKCRRAFSFTVGLTSRLWLLSITYSTAIYNLLRLFHYLNLAWGTIVTAPRWPTLILHNFHFSRNNFNFRI